MRNWIPALLASAAVCAAAPRLTTTPGGFRIESAVLTLECGRDLGLRAFLNKEGARVTLSAAQAAPAVTVRLEGGREVRFSLLAAPGPSRRLQTEFGAADRFAIKAAGPGKTLLLDLALDFPKRHPDVVILRPRFTNARNGRAQVISEVHQAALRLASAKVEGADALFWSLQGGGYRWGRDWVLPVRAGFTQDNDTGPKGKANGGGFPFVDLWRPDSGVAVALLDPKPALAKVPVAVSQDGIADVSVVTRPAAKLPPGRSYEPAPSVIIVHRGDFYDPMVRYRQLMADLGVAPVTEYEPDDYAPAWCTWGYQRKFTMEGTLAKLPQMREMGMTDFILDDGWFDRFGDWAPTPQKFPDGDAGIKAAIRRVHEGGLKFRLWWVPGAADPGSEMYEKHPDWFILDRDGRKEKASWEAYYLCPSYPPVRQAMRELVRRFVSDWRVDSFKLDGTSLNHAPLCYNPAHRHARPEEAFEEWPAMLREIRAEARRLKPGFRVELCPCGITPTFQLATAMEQPTDSDPYDHQVTSRTKFLKAMFGPRCPVLQEYVGLGGVKDTKRTRIELYARAIGTGQVPSSFAMDLTETHARWSAIYNRHRPAEGEYLNLYDIGWEEVDGHAIRKGDRFYYGFFSRKPGEAYSGKVQLRGLGGLRYQVTDYAAGRDLGVFTGPTVELPVRFQDALLLVATPAP